MNERNERRRRYLWTAPVIMMLAMTAVSAGATDTNLRVIPDSLRIGSFFGGAWVQVSAEIPEGCGAVVEVIGKDNEEQLLRKGRHWEIWMTVGEIDIEGAPCLYYALSTDSTSLTGVAPDSTFGYNVLEKRVSFLGDVKDLKRIKVYDEFIRLKESEELYGEYPGRLQVLPLSNGRSLVQGAFRVPSRVVPGRYAVRLSVLKDGRLVDTQSAGFGVALVRLPAFLSSLARRHGGFYGLLAVVVAVAFGYFTGIVFKRTRWGH